MGSGRDKRKKQKGKQPGAGTEKTEKKTEKNAEKAQRRAEKKAAGGEDDIDALLAQFALSDRAATRTEVQTDVPPPSARVHVSFTPLPLQKQATLAMFGGEYTDPKTDKTDVFRDLYLYNAERNTWARVVAPGAPPPRSAHQAVAHKGYLWLFGGEFTSRNQEKFRHYKDLWRFSLEEHTWEQLPARGGPSARSGHRMAVYKNRLLLFGGFYDADKEIRYYNDVWEFDTDELKWEAVAIRPGAVTPAPRGGCQVAVAGDVLFVFGGHSVFRDEDGEEVDKLHDDIWALDLKARSWERVKKAGMAPSPRASFGLVVHKARAILFGGVTDRAGAGERLYSEVHADLYQFNFSSRRWFPAALRPPKAAAGAAAAAAAADAPSTQAAGPEAAGILRPDLAEYLARGGGALHAAAVRIQSRYRGYVVRKAYQTYQLGGKVSELLYSPATYGVDFGARDVPRPRARASPAMAVTGNTLWLWGGNVEVAHADVTLDDLWCLDLAKMDAWRCVKDNSAGEDAFRDDSDWETDSGGEEED